MKKVSRWFAVVLASILMLNSLGMSVVFAAEADYADFVPGDIPDNIFVRPSNANSFWNRSAARVGEPYELTTSNAKFIEVATAPLTQWGAGPMLISGSANITKNDDGYAVVAGKNYVFAATLRNDTTETVPEITFALSGYQIGKTLFSLPITNSEYERKQVVFTSSHSLGSITMGFDAYLDRSDRGENLGILDMAFKGDDAMYLAEEVCYDITCELTGEATLLSGESTTIETAIVNQLGMTDSFDQSITCIALNEDRTDTVDGFSYTYNNDGTTTIHADENLETGNYVILARSNSYEGMQKGVSISVKSAGNLVEYFPNAKPDNMIKNPTTINSFTGGNGSGGQRVQYNNEGYIRIKESAAAASTYFGAGPVNVGSSLLTYSGDNAFELGEQYVISAYMRNPTPDITPTYKAAFNTCAPHCEPYRVDVSNTEFEQKIIYFTPPKSSSYIAFGSDTTVDKSALTEDQLGYLDISITSGTEIYVAKEQPYNIYISGDNATTEVEGGDTVSLKAEVVNQLEETGTLSQEFEWYILDGSKTIYSFDIAITPDSEDSSVATAQISEDIAAGTYYAVAKSVDYPELVRFYPFVVGAIEEYVPAEIPANIILDPYTINSFTGGNGSGGSRLDCTGDFIRIQEINDKDNDTYWSAGPVFLKNEDKTLLLDDEEGYVLRAGKDYVLSVSLRNETPEVEPNLSFGFNYLVSTTPITIPVTSSEFETSIVSFTPAKDAASIWFGIDATTTNSKEDSEQGILNVNMAEGYEVYLAEEIPYIIEETITNGDNVLTRGDSVTVSAEVHNQLGTKGNLSQDINWTMMDSNKTPVDYGFELTTEDANTVTVDVGMRTVPGTYYLMASNSDGSVYKFIELLVKYDGLSYYVSPDGSDSNPGTLAAPFKTIEKARDTVSVINNMAAYEFIDVVLRGGDYVITTPIRFTGSNSGMDGSVIRYRAYEGEEPVLKNSVELDPSLAREPLDKSVIERIRPEAQGKIVVFDLAEHGIADSDVMDFSQSFAGFYNLTNSGEQNALYVDGKEQTISAWPNDRDYATRGNAIIDETYVDSEGNTVNVSTSFYYTDEEPDRWANATNWYIGAFIPYDYSYARISGDYVDVENKVIHTDPPASTNSFNYTNNFTKRWKAFNLLEEIDLPGEYCIDSDNLLLYYYPQGDISDSRLELSLMGGNLITVTGAKNITFQGLTFTQCGKIALNMKDVDNVDVLSCTFRDISGSGLFISGTKEAETNKDYWQREDLDASYNVDIKDNVFIKIGALPMSVSGGNVDYLIPSNNFIENNFIYDYANLTNHNMAGGIHIEGCGVTVRHNNVGYSAASAMAIGGNNHLIEYNEFYEVLRENQDAGVIYQGRNAIARGTTIRYNYIHDAIPLGAMSQSSQVGVYLDDCQLGLNIYNNFFRNIKADFNANGGADYKFVNNTSVDVQSSWQMLNHKSYSTDPVEKGPSGSLEFIESQVFNKELYYEEYPTLELFLQGNNPRKYTVFSGNLTANAGRVYFEATTNSTQDIQWATMENYDSITDETYSNFVDVANHDLRLKSDSPYAMYGRSTEDNFDIDLIGLQRDYTIDSSFDTVYPAAGSRIAAVDGSVTLSWTSAVGATSYRIELATDASFAEPVLETESRTTTCVVDGLEEGTYYWRVTAIRDTREFAYEVVGDTSSFTLGAYEHDVSLDDTYAVTDDTGITLASTLVNNCSEDEVFTVSFASYKGDSLVESARYSVTAGVGVQAPISHTFTSSDEADEIKIFVWRDSSLVPIRSVRTIKR